MLMSPASHMLQKPSWKHRSLRLAKDGGSGGQNQRSDPAHSWTGGKVWPTQSNLCIEENPTMQQLSYVYVDVLA